MFDINDTLAKVRKARFSDRLVIEDEYGDEYTVTQRELEQAEPVVDITDWLAGVNENQVTTAELEKLMLVKATRVEIDDQFFPVKALAKAKVTRVLTFSVLDWDDATLDTKGRLSIGCQTHSLDEWAGQTGEELIDTRASSYGREFLEELRDSLIPILRRKLANERAKHPVKTKRRAA